MSTFKRWIVAGSTIGVLLAVLLSSIGASGAPVAAANSPQVWSYSHQNWTNATGNRSHGGYGGTYSIQSHEAFQYTITATNTSTTTTEMAGVRTLTATFNATACLPNCTAPRAMDRVAIAFASQQTQYLNFTTAATVYENGSAATALGITNGSENSASTYTSTESLSYGNSSWNASVNGAQSSYEWVQFSPSLGLIPWALSTNLTWNSTSAFSAGGGWNDSFTASAMSGSGSRSYNYSSSGTVNGTGNESIRGHDFGNRTVANHTTMHIGLRFGGPFNFDGSLFMTAIGSDLFQGATSNWTVRSPAALWTTAESSVTGVYEARAAVPGSGDSSGGTSSGSSGTTGTSGTTGGSGSTTPTGGTTTPVGTGATAPTKGTAPGSTAPPTSPSPTTAVPVKSPSTGSSFAVSAGLLTVVGLLATIAVVGAVLLQRRSRR